MLKKIQIVLVILAAFLCSLFVVQAATVFQTIQGGTGTSSPSGILYGSGSASPLKTVSIGSNLTFSGGTLSATDVTFSTTSSNFWASAGLAFSTTSSDYWKTQNNFFSTTSADFWSSAGFGFSTTSATYFLNSTTSTGFSTTSANYYVHSSTTIPKTYTANTYSLTQTFTLAPIFTALSGIVKGNGASAATVAVDGTDFTLIDVSTCSAGLAHVSVTAAGVFTCGTAFSTTSAQYFTSVGLTFSTTSANYWASVGLAHSTTSSDYWLTRRQGAAFSTTSANYWSTFGLGFSTTSANYWSTFGLGFSTTSANYWKTQTTFTGASTSLLTDTNSFTGKNAFSEATSTRFNSSFLSFTGATGTAATTTNLYSLFGNITFASSSALTVSGTGYFGTASTSNLTVSTAQNGVLVANTTGVVTASSTLGLDRIPTCVLITGSAALCDGDDASGAGGSYPFSTGSYNGQTTAATSTLMHLTGSALSLAASSSHLTFATSTAFFTKYASSTNLFALNATTSNLAVSGLLTFNGVTASTWAAFCTTITGGSGLCDGTDNTGGGGVSGSTGQFVYIDGSATAVGTSSVFLSTAGRVGIGTTTFDSLQPARLSIEVPSGDTTEEALSIYGNVDDFFEGNIKNVSTGANAQSCWTATANTGTLTTGFVSMCQNNSNFYNPQTYNVGGGGDGSIMGLPINDFYMGSGTAGKNVYIFAGGTGTSTTDYRRISILGTNGNIGIGTSSPFATLSVNSKKSTVDEYNTPIFSFGSSDGTAPFSYWATSSVLTMSGLLGNAEWGGRLGIGVSRHFTYPTLLDTDFNGRWQNVGWVHQPCETPTGLFGTGGQAVTGCAGYIYEVGGASALGGLYPTVATGTAVTYYHFGGPNSGVTGTTWGNVFGVYTGDLGQSTWLSLGSSTPVMETVARINTPAATTTHFVIGFDSRSVRNGSTATIGLEPATGCFFMASTSLANWQAIAAVSAASRTIYDTGIASTSNSSAVGSFYRFRIEGQSGSCAFYIETPSVSMKKVAVLSTTTPSATTAMWAGLTIGRYTATGKTQFMDMRDMHLWTRVQPLQ